MVYIHKGVLLNLLYSNISIITKYSYDTRKELQRTWGRQNSIKGHFFVIHHTMEVISEDIHLS
jgi:hypothetical protein